MKKITLLLLILGIAMLSTTCKNTKPADKPHKKRGPAAGVGNPEPSVMFRRASIDEFFFDFTPPSNWGTRDNGTAVEEKDVKFWFYYLEDPDGTKTKEDIIAAVGDAAVIVNLQIAAGKDVVTDLTKGVVQMQLNKKATNNYKLRLNVETQYTFFVRIIHPDSSIADKTAPKANEGRQYSRDTAVARGSTNI